MKLLSSLYLPTGVNLLFLNGKLLFLQQQKIQTYINKYLNFLFENFYKNDTNTFLWSQTQLPSTVNFIKRYICKVIIFNTSLKIMDLVFFSGSFLTF